MAGLLNTVVVWDDRRCALCQDTVGLKMILGENQLILPTSGNFDNLRPWHDFTQREYAAYFPFYQKANIWYYAHRGYFSIFAAKNAAASVCFSPWTRIWKC